MKIHAGYEIAYDCLQPTPMIITLSVHPSLRSNLLTPDHEPRIGRILIARGRDATDVAITTSFGPHQLVGFSVTTDEVAPEELKAVP
jgi:hypothetical protein